MWKRPLNALKLYVHVGFIFMFHWVFCHIGYSLSSNIALSTCVRLIGFFSFFAAMGWFCYVLITIKDALTVAGHPEKPTVQVGFALLQTTVSAKFRTDSVGFIHYDPLDALCFIFDDFSPKQTLLNLNSGYAFNGPLIHPWSERFVQHFVTSHYFFQLGNKTKNQKKKKIFWKTIHLNTILKGKKKKRNSINSSVKRHIGELFAFFFPLFMVQTKFSHCEFVKTRFNIQINK